MNDNMLRVLRFLAEHFTPSGVHRLNTPFEVPGLAFDEQIAPALARLASATPPYIEGVGAAQANYPIVVLGLTERGWEASEAAGEASDGSPGSPASAPIPTAKTENDEQFEIALSFAGEQRAFVQRVASALIARGVEVFFDEEAEVQLWGKNLVEEFQRIYMDASHAVAMFISAEYAGKPWTRHERRSALSRALRERGEYILPIRFDNTELEGLSPDIAAVKIGDRTPEEIASMIAEKLVRLGVSLPASRSPVEGASMEPIVGLGFVVEVSDAGGNPVGGAQVLAVGRNGVFVSGLADESGSVELRLPAERLVTVFVAHSQLSGAIVRDHDPSNGLRVTLPANDGEGSVIFEGETGYIPGLEGRLNPIRDSRDRLLLYADNIAIDDDPRQPRRFQLGQPMVLEDSGGARRVVTIVEVIGRSSLLIFR